MTKVATIIFLALLIPAPASAQNQEAVGSVTRNAATFVSDLTIPDGTVMSPGQSFTKTWQIRNSGSTSWSGYSLAFFGGSQMGAPSSVSVPMTPPGATVDISVSMTAPTDAGAHRGNWRMRTADGQSFMQDVFVLISVDSSSYQGRTFEEWETSLRTDSPAARIKTIEALHRFGTRATSVLIKTFRSDSDENVRAYALGTLADTNPPTNDTLRVLLEAVTDPSPGISISAVMVIQEVLPSRIGPETVSVLVEAMRDSNPLTRQLAIRLLAPLGPAAKEAVPTLRGLAEHDPEPTVRNVANEALKWIETHGAISGENYVSPRNWFSVQVPTPSNWANIPFSMQDTSVDQPGVGNYDLVSFGVTDFGEVLIASVRHIPEQVIDMMKQDDNRTVLSNLAEKALYDWRNFPIELKVIEDIYLNTPYGESLLRIYSAEKGSLLLGASGRRPNPSDTLDTLIAVIVAKEKSHYIYVIAENDSESNRTDKNKEALKRRAKSFFGSIVVHH